MLTNSRIVISPFEVQRQVTLVLTLEPIADKEGCTTRYRDMADTATLADFLGSAVNTSQYFYQLAERVVDQSGQPEFFYDLGLTALQTSKTNFRNKKLNNYGLIELLLPLIVSRLTGVGDGVAVCKHVPNVLRASSGRDVEFLDQMRALAWSGSHKAHKRDYPKIIGGNNLYEHHQNNVQVGARTGYRSAEAWSRQLLDGLPLVQEMYLEARQHLDQGLIAATEQAYKLGREKTDYSAGFIADYAAAVGYLLLSEAGARAEII